MFFKPRSEILLEENKTESIQHFQVSYFMFYFTISSGIHRPKSVPLVKFDKFNLCCYTSDKIKICRATGRRNHP